MKKKANRVCIITGGSQGIGLAVGKYLLKKNYKVAVLDVLFEKGIENYKKEIEVNKAVVIKADVTSLNDINNSFNEVLAKFGRIDILINNAGITIKKCFIDETEEDFKKVLEVNLVGTFLCCKVAVPIMIRQDFGRIVNLSSIVGLKPSIFSCTSYCASKAGIIGFSRSLASQLAKYNIRVNCIAPSPVETKMIEDISDDARLMYLANTPISRLAKPIEIAYAIYFLISDKSDYITGETININGGNYMP